MSQMLLRRAIKAFEAGNVVKYDVAVFADNEFTERRFEFEGSLSDFLADFVLGSLSSIRVACER